MPHQNWSFFQNSSTHLWAKRSPNCENSKDWSENTQKTERVLCWLLAHVYIGQKWHILILSELLPLIYINSLLFFFHPPPRRRKNTVINHPLGKAFFMRYIYMYYISHMNEYNANITLGIVVCVCICILTFRSSDAAPSFVLACVCVCEIYLMGENKIVKTVNICLQQQE